MLHLPEAGADRAAQAVKPNAVTSLPRFIVTTTLGESGISVVARARDLERNCEVALKRLTKSLYTDCGWDYPPLEAQLRLRHPNVVLVLDQVLQPDHLLLVLEYLPGGDLYHCFQQVGIFAEPLSKPLLSDLVSAVSFLHRSGIAHRDLKPENCVLTADGTLKVVDFGLAVLFKPGQTFFDFCGSAEYAAPEIRRSMPYEAPPVDVWAIGVILYEMCVGDLPPWNFGQGSAFASPSSPASANTAPPEGRRNNAIAFPFPEAEIAEAGLTPELTLLLKQTMCESVADRITVEQIATSPWLQSLKLTLLAKEIVMEDLVQEIASAPLRERVTKELRAAMQEELGFNDENAI